MKIPLHKKPVQPQGKTARNPKFEESSDPLKEKARAFVPSLCGSCVGVLENVDINDLSHMLHVWNIYLLHLP